MSDRATLLALAERPVRVQLRRSKGWRMPENTVKVDRTTKWGNPYRPGQTFRGIAVQDNRHAFRCYQADAPGNEMLIHAARNVLRGKNLACWCSHDEPCHADVLLEIANAEVTP